MSAKTVTFKGTDYTVAENVFDDVNVLEAWEDEKHVALCRAILGAAQWKTFKASSPGAADMYNLLGLLVDSAEDEESAEA